jgi:hypothetical protein
MWRLVLLALALPACAAIDGIDGDYQVRGEIGAGGTGGDGAGAFPPVTASWSVAIEADASAVRSVVALPDGALATGSFSGLLSIGERTAGPSFADDGFVVRLGATGNVIWLRTFGGPNADVGRAVALAGDAVVVVASCQDAHLSEGDIVGTAGGADVCVLRLDPITGGVLGASSFGGPSSEGVTDVLVDGDRLVMTGNIDGAIGDWQSCDYVSPASAGDGSTFTARLESNGDCTARGYAQPGTFQLAGSVTLVDGDVFVSGETTVPNDPEVPTEDGRAGFAARLDDSGSEVQTVLVDGKAQDVFSGLATTSTGALVVAGQVSSGAQLDAVVDATGQRGFVGALDAGRMSWTWGEVFGASDVAEEVAARAVTAAGGRIHVVGDFYGAGQTFGASTFDAIGLRDVFLVTLDEEGTPIEARQFGADGGEYALPHDVSADPESGGIVVGGVFQRAIQIAGDPLASDASLTGFVGWLMP